MSSIKSFFDKYLPFPDRKRKLSEDKANDFAPKRKLPRLSQLSVVGRRTSGGLASAAQIDHEPVSGHFRKHHYQYPSQQQQHHHLNHFPPPVPPLNPLPKPRSFFSPAAFSFRRPTVYPKHSSRYGMDSIELDSDEDVELVEYLQTCDMSPGSFGRLTNRHSAPRPLPALIPRNRTQPINGSCSSSLSQHFSQGSGSSSSTVTENGHCSTKNPYAIFKKRFNVASPQIRAPGGSSRGGAINTALQKSFMLEEKQKYSEMCNGMAPRTSKAGDGSLFGALQRSSVLGRFPFSTKNTINIGSRNRYGQLLEKYSADIDTRRGATSLRPNVGHVKPTTCVDLTSGQQKMSNGGVAAELTDDDDEEEEEDVVIDLEGEEDGNEATFKIPKSFPCAQSLDNQQLRHPWKASRASLIDPQSPRAILMALDRAEEEDDLDESPTIVLDYDDDQEALGATSSRSSQSSRSTNQRKVEKIDPVNSLLDEWQAKPMFKDDWLEVTRRRYTERQEQWTAKIEEEQERQAEADRESRQDVQDMIKKMDEALLLREVIVVEDEEEELARLAAAEKQKDTPLPAFTADQMNMIRYAAGRGSPDEVLITKFNLSITRRDIATLLGDSWLNDEVINFYMNLLMERSEREGYPKCYAMNTFFMPKVLQQGQSGVRRWTRKVDLFTHDVIPVPVHVSNIHWCMAIIHLKDRYIRYYDSMGQPNNRVLDALEQYLKDESLDKRKAEFSTEGWVKESVANCPRQMNGSDCGVFSCMFAEYVSRGHRINFTQDNMPYFRQKMILEICSGKLLL